jgi:hypothetical protein
MTKPARIRTLSLRETTKVTLQDYLNISKRLAKKHNFQAFLALQRRFKGFGCILKSEAMSNQLLTIKLA